MRSPPERSTDAMAADTDWKALEQSAALRRISPEARARVGAAMVPREVAASGVIWRMGEPLRERGLYLVVSGEVSVAHHGPSRSPTVSRTVGPGSIFGESTLISEGPSQVGARALSPSRLLLLARDRFEALSAEIPALRGVLEDLQTLRALEPEVIAGMRRSALARHFSPRSLAELCDVAELVRFAPDEAVLRQGEGAPGFFFVVSGELKVTVRGDGGAAVLVDTLHPGDVFGDVALITGLPQPSTVTAWSAVRLARVRVEAYRRMLEVSQSHRRGVRSLASEGPDPIASVTARLEGAPEHARQGETRLLLSSVRAPTAMLCELIAEALATDHGDHVLVVGFPRPGGASVPSTRLGGRLAFVDLDTDDASAPARLTELLGRVGARFDYVLLDAADRGDAFLASIEHRVDRVVHLTHDTYAPLPTRALAQVPVLHAVLLGAPRPRREVSTMPTMHSGTVRVRLDVDTLSRRRGVRLDALAPHERTSLARLARAVSNRRVGVALGGGGSWGYAHLTLLTKMAAAGVPVDLIAGCSFGALVGAYWCALGAESVDLLIRNGAALRNTVLASMVTSHAIGALVERDLGRLRLEDLEVPLFPVATDVATGTQRAIKSGPVARGVRASSAFPGIFGPVTSRGFRLVDGGIINNVPEDVLVSEGADLVVASNVVSPPAAMRAIPRPSLPGEFGRIAHEVNPLGRMSDLVRSTLILMHSAGSRDAHLADITYNAAPVAHMPWDFSRGEEIMRGATPEVERVIEQIRDAWGHLARPAAHREALDASHLEAP
jgi:predicted acylesterase/phospholipase RssA/CRP-like cAMP-binding protein